MAGEAEAQRGDVCIGRKLWGQNSTRLRISNPEFSLLPLFLFSFVHLQFSAYYSSVFYFKWVQVKHQNSHGYLNNDCNKDQKRIFLST